MTYLYSFLLGLIQALTEFLPVSSSGHLLISRRAFNFDVIDGLTFDVALHVGTLVAIVVYFRADIARVIRGAVALIAKRDWKNDEQRLAGLVIIGCIPAGIVGLFLENAIEVYLRNPSVVVVTLILGGVLFLVVERFARGTRDVAKMTLTDALAIGFAQTLALVPGVSRSGITIVTGLGRGISRHEAARYSFLMAAPLLAAAGALKAFDLGGQSLGGEQYGVLVVGVITSALAGWLVIRFLLAFLRKHTLNAFAYYRFVVALVLAGLIYL